MAGERLPLHGRDHRPGGCDPVSGIGGIQFDTYPQDGDWLYVKVTDSSTSPNGYGMELIDFSTGGMQLTAADASISLGQTAGLGVGVFIDSYTGITLNNHSDGRIYITNTRPDGIHIEDTYSGAGSGVEINSQNGPVDIFAKTTLGLSSGSFGTTTLEAGIGGTVDITAGSGASKRDLILVEDSLIFYDQGAVVFSAIRNVVDPTRWDFTWVDPFDNSDVMTVTWSGAAWDYKIKTGAAWAAVL